MSTNKNGIYKFGLFTASAFVIANMIGTGVFTALGFLLLGTTNFVSVMLLWLFGGLIALCGALVYGELGSVMPRSGGEYHYLREIYHPIVGFMSGWASLIVGFAAPVALACMAMAKYIYMVFPVFTPTIIALVMLILITGLHAYDVKAGGAVQRYFTIFKILIILVFIICGLFLPDTHQDVSGSFSAFSLGEIFSSSFAVSLIWVYYAYSGWNASAYMAGEIRNPQKTLPRSLLISTLIVTVLYLLLNAVFLLAAPVDELTGQIEVGFIAAQYIFGEGIGNIVALLIAVLLISSISSMVFLAPRVSQVMGEDTYILKPLSRRSKKGTPYIAIWIQFTISFLLIITDSFELVTKYTGITISFFALLAVVGIFIHRKRYPDVVRPYKTWGYPVTPIIFIVLITWSIVYLIHEDYSRTFVEDTQNIMWMSLMSLATLLSGAGVYWLNKIIVNYREKKYKKI